MRKQICHLFIVVIMLVVIFLMISRVTDNVSADVETPVEQEQVEIDLQPEHINAYNVTKEEREMLARLVFLEANTESIECQKAIVSVVFNRLDSGRWGDTLYDVIYYPYQFTPAYLIDTATPTQTNYDAVDYVLKHGSIVPDYVLYFRAKYGFSKVWDDYAEYIKISNTYFGYFLRDKK